MIIDAETCPETDSDFIKLNATSRGMHHVSSKKKQKFLQGKHFVFCLHRTIKISYAKNI